MFKRNRGLTKGLPFLILFISFFFVSQACFAQTGKIYGSVVNKDTKDPMILVNIEIIGTSFGATTDLDGRYVIHGIPFGSYTARASYIGYTSQTKKVEVELDSETRLDFELESEIITNKEIEVLATRAKDRETPVSFTDLPKAELVRTLGSRDIPMVLNSTPGVYATEQGGGAGDARISIRGFSQRNVAVMINGVPVNDMENGWVYWSNWDGIGDATSSVQVQRGMGAANLAISSVGGTMNIITDAASMKSGAKFKQEIGDDGFSKSTLTLSSGLLYDKLAVTGSFVRKTGDGFAEKTWIDAYAYFLGMSYLPHERHKVDFFAIGAPQAHGQRTWKQPIAVWDTQYALDIGVHPDTINAHRREWIERGLDYNWDWGPINLRRTSEIDSLSPPMKVFYNGEEHDIRDDSYINRKENYYHKPQLNLNWYWDFNPLLDFSNIFYYSYGEGGGTTNFKNAEADYPAMDRYGHQDYQTIYERHLYNIDPEFSETERRATLIVRNSVNAHNWYGWIGNAEFTFTEYLKFTLGIDLRSYEGEHWAEVRNLLGGDYFVDFYNGEPNDMNDKNEDGTYDPKNSMRRLGDKIYYHDKGLVNWQGVFGTAEYHTSKMYVFGNVGVSNTDYKRIDYFELKLPNGDWDELPWRSFKGFGVKGGANYNLTGEFQVWGNAGYINIAPKFNAVFNNYHEMIDPVENEKVTSFEIGVGYRRDRWLDVDANYYNTYWADKTSTKSVQDTVEADTWYNYHYRGVDAVHQGVELSVTTRPHKLLKITGMASLNNWEWADNVHATFELADAPGVSDSVSVYIKGLKVGDAPQTAFSLSTSFYPVQNAYFTLIMKRFMDHYADFNPFYRRDREEEGVQPWKLPAYNLVDMHFGYTIPFIKSFRGRTVNFTFSGHVFNLLDQKYITDAEDSVEGGGHAAQNSVVFMGRPRRVNLGFTVHF